MTPQQLPLNRQGSYSSSQLAKDTGLIAVITLLSRVLGLVRDAVIARALGAGFYSDVFYAAFRIPNLLRRMVAEGAFTTVFVPIISTEILKSKKEANEAIGGVLAVCIIFTTSLTVLGVVFSSQLTTLFVPGWSLNSEKSTLTAALLEVMLPYIIFVSLISLASGILNSLGHFAASSFNQVIFNLVIIAGIFISIQFGFSTIYTLSFSVLVAGLLSLLPLLQQLKRLGYPLRLCSPRKSPAVSQLIRLFLPVLFTASIYQLIIFLNLIFASLLEEGSLSWLYYADRLFQFPLGIFTFALAQALLPTLSRQAASEDSATVTTSITNTLSWITFFTIPAGAGLYLLADPIIQVIYQGGTFTTVDAQRTAGALQAMSIGLWAISCQNILARVFIAYKNTFVASLVSLASITLYVLFTLALMGPPRSESEGILFNSVYQIQTLIGIYNLGHLGIALSGSIVAFFSLALSLILVRKLNINIKLSSFFSSLIKPLIATATMAIFLKYCICQISVPLILLSVGIPLGVFVFLIACLVLRQPQAINTFLLLKHTKLRSKPS